MYTDKVYTSIDHAPAAFDLRGRILGPNGNNLDYIKSETGAIVFLKGGSSSTDPLHVVLQHTRTDGVSSARSLTLNLIETVKNELQQWSSQTAQAVSAAAVAGTEIPPASTDNTATEIPSQPVNIAPAASAAATNSSVVTVRPQTVLQLMPQQQYILNQDGSQLIPLMQPGQIPGHGNFTQLIGSFPQSSNGTQFVDANLQPVSMAQFRLSGIQNSMPTFIQNGMPLPQVSLANQDSTTVSYTSLLPVSSAVSSPSTGPGSAVHAVQTGGQKLQWSGEKVSEKNGEVKYQYQVASGEQVQLSMPASGQTMYIPYHQLQELTGQSAATLQPQFVSISAGGGAGGWPAGALQQIAQLPPGASLNPNILHLNQKQPGGNTSVINLWPAQPGAAAVPAHIAPAQQIIAPQPGQIWPNQQVQIASGQGTTSAAIKATGGQEIRAQKRLADGTPTQMQLRPIAPAGSQISQQDKLMVSRESRPVVWAPSTGRETVGNSGNQMTQKSSGSRVAVSSISTQSSTGSITLNARDSTASPARQVDKNATSANQEGTKSTEAATKVSTLPHNIQMYAISSNGTPIQNIAHAPTSLAQSSTSVNHMYLVPSSQGGGLQSVAMPQNTMMGQTLQVGQGNIPMMQPNQLSLPQGVQYNTMPFMQLPQQHMQYITSGLNLNNPSAAQQLGLAMAGQQVLNPAMLSNLQSNNPNQVAPLNQQSMQAFSNQVTPSSQTSGSIQYTTTQLQNSSQPAPQFISPNPQQQNVGNTAMSFASPASQYAGNSAQFATHQGNFILPGQGSVPLQYNVVNQPVSAATQLNTSLQPGDSRGNFANTGQTNSYPTANTPNANPPNALGPGVTQQTYQPGTPVAPSATQQPYPAVGSPSSIQQVAPSVDNLSSVQVTNYSASVAPNQPGNYQQAGAASNSFPNGNTSLTGQPAPFNGNQYAVTNNNKNWTGQRFGGPPGNRPQYTVPTRPDQPSAPVAPSPTNPNYWQFS